MERAASEEEDERTQPLAAGANEAENQFGDRWELDVRGLLQPRFDPVKLRPHCCKDASRPDIYHRSPRTARDKFRSHAMLAHKLCRL
jgi:hypothetical protein